MGSYTLGLMPMITPTIEQSLKSIRCRRNTARYGRASSKTLDRNLEIYRACVQEHKTIRSAAMRFGLSIQTVEKILHRLAKAIQNIERRTGGNS